MLACICVLRYGICYYNFQLNVIYFFSVCVGTYMHVWRSEDKFQKLVFFSCHVTSRGYTHAVNLGVKCFYLLTEHLTSLGTVLYCVCVVCMFIYIYPNRWGQERNRKKSQLEYEPR